MSRRCGAGKEWPRGKPCFCSVARRKWGVKNVPWGNVADKPVSMLIGPFSLVSPILWSDSCPSKNRVCRYRHRSQLGVVPGAARDVRGERSIIDSVKELTLLHLTMRCIQPTI